MYDLSRKMQVQFYKGPKSKRLPGTRYQVYSSVYMHYSSNMQLFIRRRFVLYACCTVFNSFLRHSHMEAYHAWNTSKGSNSNELIDALLHRCAGCTSALLYVSHNFTANRKYYTLVHILLRINIMNNKKEAVRSKKYSKLKTHLCELGAWCDK